MIFLIYLGIGILSNFIGPLAKHLAIEDKYSLKENKNKSWFYRYSFNPLGEIIWSKLN